MLQRVLAEPVWMARMMPARLGPRQPLRRLRPRYEATARPGYPCRGLRPATLYRTHFVRSGRSASSGLCGLAAMLAIVTDGRNVESATAVRKGSPGEEGNPQRKARPQGDRTHTLWGPPSITRRGGWLAASDTL